MSDEIKNRPTKQFRCGAVSVSVFKREHNGEVFYNATPSRAYTKDDGKTWNYSDSFSRDELPVVAALMNQAFSWVVAQSYPKQ
jgi:hypothetical protein